MNPSISSTAIRSDIPMFMYTLDENEEEYIICNGKFPMLIKVTDFEYEYVNEEGEDDDDEDDDSDVKDTEGSLTGDFHVEILKYTNTGLKPLGYEKETKAVKQIIRRAIDFYLALEEDPE